LRVPSTGAADSGIRWGARGKVGGGDNIPKNQKEEGGLEGGGGRELVKKYQQLSSDNQRQEKSWCSIKVIPAQFMKQKCTRIDGNFISGGGGASRRKKREDHHRIE